MRDLTAYIQRRYHAIHLNRLFVATRLARRVELEFAAHPACPQGFSHHLNALAEDIEIHQAKERDEVFPSLVYGLRSSQKFPVLRMMIEHDGFAEELDSLSAMTRGYTVPDDANTDWNLLCAT
ncbi:regulator of cell morphogenesis and NO signaling [Asticcacaulis biprosthecium C19]|uniref:Regulator of cell morphogenesis and NO signaling n=1 Tax=Asticcacaulis biprosthecium C19 TaxID=715226 RepID=F4QTB9_9CAUL|nr:regulator of cell morphogenesis and NO signaling [Asticcacaulis biprosthecium C19]